MKLSIGIVGLPNVGKSTLFQALTKKQVDVANYPFCTIDPNVGVVQVPDERAGKLSEFFHSAKTIGAVVEFVDIAGLVRGANKGEGLGNQFLANIREVDAICQVIRLFENKDIIHVENSVDPLRDMDTILIELLLKDLETVEKRLESVEREAKSQKKEAIAEQAALLGVKTALSAGMLAREYFNARPKEEESVRHLQLLTAKPILYLLNGEESQVPPELARKLQESGAPFVVMNIKEEADLGGLSHGELKDLGFESKLPLLIRKAYEVLDLMTFFTTGEDETRAWTIRRGSFAPQAGGAIHSDFEQKFIRAMVIPWDKLLEAGGYAQATAKGWIRTEGKEYVAQDGDVIEIKHG
ncbi:MAG: redox-regulated ATPase YchF [Candidatus Wildermuthbacteria bacterium]|nr:redox-regulated ATPase YchF [Candidatus Wildermuthbacteria bacterium]